MSKDDKLSRMIEQLYLKLLSDLSSSERDIIFEDGNINLDTEDFEFELRVKPKRKFVLIKPDE